MCGGLWNMKSRCSARFLDNTKPPPAAPADAQLLIASSRHYPASPAAGLAIVAALEAELVQSESATSVRSTTLSSISSLPIYISSSASSSSSSSSSSLEEETKDHILCDPDDRNAPKPTIFSTSLSPPSSYDILSCTLYKELSYGDFLGVCFSCNRPLGPGKDIYMYRGDQAFCSIECRYNHIVADESLHRSIHINQQCVQASSPTSNQSEVTPLIAIPILA